ncbi:MAG: hypothetical protein ACRC1M_00285 [Methanobacteriaceae archaeon]
MIENLKEYNKKLSEWISLKLSEDEEKTIEIELKQFEDSNPEIMKKLQEERWNDESSIPNIRRKNGNTNSKIKRIEA